MDKDSAAIALGARIRRLRRQRGITLNQLKERVGLRSSGYLSDIETGNKSVTLPRLRRIAKQLGTTAEELIAESTSQVGTQIYRRDALEQSFSKVARSPIDYFIHATDSTTRGIGPEHVLREMVRWQIQTKDDPQLEVETHAATFAANLPERRYWCKAMESWLEDAGIGIDSLEKHSSSLPDVRSILIGGQQKLLLVRDSLSPARRLFVLAREIGYQQLPHVSGDHRSYLYPPDREATFDQVLRDYRASCFAGAVLLPTAELRHRLTELLQSPTWDPSAFERILDDYSEVATEETFMYRFGQIMFADGLKSHFLKIVSPKSDLLRLDKQINLSVLSGGAAINWGEHLCNRWLAARVINKLRKLRKEDPNRRRFVDAQISQYRKGDDSQASADYFGISVALRHDPGSQTRTGTHTTSVEPPADTAEGGAYVSFTVGFKLGTLATRLAVVDDLRIVRSVVCDACERCSEPNCDERAKERGTPVEATWLSRDREIRRLLGMG